jgi:hypothetical protein
MQCMYAPLAIPIILGPHFPSAMVRTYFVTWSTGAGLLLSAPLPWPVCPALGISPPPEAFMPSMAGRKMLVYILYTIEYATCSKGVECRDVPSPFSISGMGATLFLVCWSSSC